MSTARRPRSILKRFGLMSAGAALLCGGVVLGGWWFADGRLASAVLGRDAIAQDCTDSLVRRLSAEGFEPADVEFGEAPQAGLPWDRDRRYGSAFTFRDGAEAVRVDGIMACLVSGGTVTVEFRVGSIPHRLG